MKNRVFLIINILFLCAMNLCAQDFVYSETISQIRDCYKRLDKVEYNNFLVDTYRETLKNGYHVKDSRSERFFTLDINDINRMTERFSKDLKRLRPLYLLNIKIIDSAIVVTDCFDLWGNWSFWFRNTKNRNSSGVEVNNKVNGVICCDYWYRWVCGGRCSKALREDKKIIKEIKKQEPEYIMYLHYEDSVDSFLFLKGDCFLFLKENKLYVYDYYSSQIKELNEYIFTPLENLINSTN